MEEPRKAHVAGQHHGEHELVHRHGLGLSLHRKRLFHQLPEAQFLQHAGDWQVAPVGGQVFGFEVIGRGSPDFIGFRSDVTNPLIGGPSTGILFLIVHRLGAS